MNQTMKIQANKEGVQAIQDLCDIALKSGWLSVLQGINTILSSITEDKEKNTK